VWWQCLLLFLVLSIRHIGNVSNAHDVTRLLRSWSMTELFTMRGWSWRRIMMTYRRGTSFRGQGSNLWVKVPTTCRPTVRAFTHGGWICFFIAQWQELKDVYMWSKFVLTTWCSRCRGIRWRYEFVITKLNHAALYNVRKCYQSFITNWWTKEIL